MSRVRLIPVSYVIAIFFTTILIEPISCCGYVEEGSPSGIRCQSEGSIDFTTIGLEVTSGDDVRTIVTCNKDGNCTVAELSNYRVEMKYDNTTDMYALEVRIKSVNRKEHYFHCVRDGATYSFCDLEVYVTPEKPVCEAPTFVADGAVISLRCTADRIFPAAVCQFQFEDALLHPDILILASYQASQRYQGDRKVTCVMRVPVRGQSEGRFSFINRVRATVEANVTLDWVEGDITLPVRLSAVELLNPLDNDHLYNVKAGDDITAAIQVTGSPPPNRFSLTVHPEAASSATYNIPFSAYSVSVSGGILHVTLRRVGRGGVEFGRYTLEASNSVANASVDYRFTLKEKDGGSSNRTAMLIGIVIGAVLLVAIVVVVFILVHRQKKRKANQRRRNGQFDDPYIIPQMDFVYPNMGYLPEPDYEQLPPPYTSNGDIPPAPHGTNQDPANEYVELDDAGYIPPKQAP